MATYSHSLENSITPNWLKLRIGLKRVSLKLLSSTIVHNLSYPRIFLGNIDKNIPSEEDDMAKGRLEIIEFSAG